MPKLSAVIITLNEARNIKRAIDSLKPVADDIIVVDSGSTDETEAICKAAGVRFEYHAWEGFGEQKNWGADLAQNDYILSLDADEALSDKLQQNLIKLKADEMHGAYSFNILPNYCGSWLRHGGWYPGRKTRLYNRKNARWNKSNVHEKLVFDGDIPVIFIEGDILHYSYNSLEDQIRKTEAYSSYAANHLFAAGKRTNKFRAYFSSTFKFIQSYILKAGFLDGKAGFVAAKYGAITCFKKYDKLYKLSKNRAGEKSV